MIDAWVEGLKLSLWNAIWAVNLAALSPARRAAVGAVRVAVTVVRDLADGQLSLRAMSLVYTTLLSMVPLLAVSFSVLKAFGVHNQMETWLLSMLMPLGEQGALITKQIVGFVENMKVGVLGSAGLAVLIYTVISLMQKIESAVNHTWHIRRTRGLLERFSRYLSVVLIGPVLVFTALGVSASLLGSAVVQQVMSVEPLGALIRFFVGIVPYLLVTAAFTFVYVYIPNTQVRIRAALVGGFVAGLLWVATGSAFATFVVASTTKYTAIYSSFAILVVFMIWLYLGWLILLTGAAVAFYVQHPEHLTAPTGTARLGPRAIEKAGLQLMRCIAVDFLQAAPPRTVAELARLIRVPTDGIDRLLMALERGRLVVQVGGDEVGNADPAYVPARDLQSISVHEILTALRATYREQSDDSDSDIDGSTTELRIVLDPVVDGIARAVESKLAEVSGARTLRDLALAEDAPDAARPQLLDAAAGRS